jgi:hypothetical protein
MKLSHSFKQRTAVAVSALAIVVAVLAALMIWNDSSGSSDAGPKASGGDDGGFDSSLRDTVQTDPNASDFTSSDDPLNPVTVGSSDPFAGAFGDNKLHTVTLRATSDGAMSTGYRFRHHKGDGSQVVSKSLTITRQVRGSLPVGQIGVQVLSNATWATCSVTIDGTEVSSHRANGPGHVVVCTG